MKSGFKDPIAKHVPVKNEKSPWNFDAPIYEESTSCYVNAGTHQGVGYKNPVGHTGNPKSRVDTLPYGRVNTMNLYPNSRNAEIQED